MENYIKSLEKLLNIFFKRDVNRILSKYSIDYIIKVKVTDRKSEFSINFKTPNYNINIYTTVKLPEDILNSIISYCVVTTSLIIQENFILEIFFIDNNDEVYYDVLSGKRFVENNSKNILSYLEDNVKDYYD